MLNILLTGIGGQGTVLAAKILAQTAQEKGWCVRSAETIGMAQRGGCVVSHVRIDTHGVQDIGYGPENTIASPLIPKKTADVIIAFEPAEGARVFPYLSDKGVIVSASTAIVPTTATLQGNTYDAKHIFSKIKRVMLQTQKLIEVDDITLMKKIGNRKALNIVLLAQAICNSDLPFSIKDLKAAVQICVKPQFVEMNLAAIDAVISQ